MIFTTVKPFLLGFISVTQLVSVLNQNVCQQSNIWKVNCGAVNAPVTIDGTVSGTGIVSSTRKFPGTP